MPIIICKILTLDADSELIAKYMARLIVTTIVFLVCFSQTLHTVHCHRARPTCASIGYSTKCCPPGLQHCTVANGDDNHCSCAGGCHDVYKDCCEDAFCRPSRSLYIIITVA